MKGLLHPSLLVSLCMEPPHSNFFTETMIAKKKQVCPPLRSQIESHKENPNTLTAQLDDNNAPLLSALKEQAARDAVKFYFPGHNRGKAAPRLLSEITGKEIFSLDSTMMRFYDKLISPKGPILAAQNRAAELFGSSDTWFLVGGTTCGILASNYGNVFTRRCADSPTDYTYFCNNALVLSGAVPKYILPEYNMYWDISGGLTPSDVQRAIKEVKKDGQRIGAVFVTSQLIKVFAQILLELLSYVTTMEFH